MCLHLRRFVAFASLFLHSSCLPFTRVVQSCTLYMLRPTSEHPWLRCRLPGRGVFLPDMINITYHGIPP